MDDVVWCEEVTKGVECEWEAEPDTTPPRCTKHAVVPKCPDTTVDGFPCTRPPKKGRDDGKCSVHGRMADGHKQGNPNPRCTGTRRGKTCTHYAVRGLLYEGRPVCSEHSNPDPAVRARLKAQALAKRETGNDRFAALLSGELAVEALTDEELLRGWPIPSNGSRIGRPPSKIPLSVHKRCTQELFKRADEKLKEGLIEAVEVMKGLMNDEDSTPADRIKAATWIYERVRGKIPDVVQHVQERPFEVVFTKVEATRRVRSERTEGTAALESYVDAEEVGDEDE